MAENPAISIIIPVYNVEEYLAECLDSVLAQTFEDFEAICIDDGSPDNCGKILDDYAQKDARIRVIHQENGGEAVARNRGLDEAKGNFIYFTDDDDYLHPQALEIMHKVLIESGLDGVVCQHRKVYERHLPMPDIETEKVLYQTVEKPLHLFLNDKKAISIAPWCKMYRRDVIGNTRFVKGIHFDDVPFNIEMLYKTQSVAIIDEVLYYFYQNPKSVSHSDINLKKVHNYLTIVRSIHEFITAQHDVEMQKAIERNCLPIYVNIVIGGVKKMRRANPEIWKEMFPVLKSGIKALLQDNIIHYSDFKLRKKWEIIKLLYL